MKLAAKDARKITNQLEAEMLIKVENVYIDDKSFLKCYYIDYQLFVDVVRYRVHIMQNSLKSEEKLELNEVYYQCPTCSEKYTSLQAQRLLSGDFKFICSHCCPVENFRTTSSEPYYRLEEVDNRGKLNNVQLSEKKMDEQFSRSKYHEGIFELLFELGDVAVSHNLPSNNMGRGIRASAVTDTDIIQDIQQNMEHATGEHGASFIKKKTRVQESILSDHQMGPVTEFSINIETEQQSSTGWDGEDSNSYRELDSTNRDQTIYEKRDTSLPSFLQQTSVIGAQDILNEARTLQATRDTITSDSVPSSEREIQDYKPERRDGASGLTYENDVHQTKRMKTEDGQGVIVDNDGRSGSSIGAAQESGGGEEGGNGNGGEGEGEEDEDDDVDWEDAEDEDT